MGGRIDGGNKNGQETEHEKIEQMGRKVSDEVDVVFLFFFFKRKAAYDIHQ